MTATHGEQLDHVEEEGGAGGHVGPDDEADDGGAGEGGHAAGHLPGPLPHVAGGLQAQERRAVQQADQHQGDAGEQGVGLEQVPEGAGEVLGRVDGQSVQQSGQGHADQQRGQQAARGQRHIPGAAPAGRVALAAVLKGHAADDQGGQQQDQREVVGREHGGVPARERGEHAGPGHDQPDLVAVPQRPDRVDGRPAARLVGADHAVQHADAEVEPLQDEKAGPQHGDDDVPERDEAAHRDLSTGRPAPARPRRRRCAGAGAARGSTSASAAGRRWRACRTAGRRPPG